METAVVQNKTEALDFIVANVPNIGTERHHVAHMPDRINKFPANIAICSDEKTGVRFGNAKCRRDKNPEKIGCGGRNRGNTAYQIWIWDVN